MTPGANNNAASDAVEVLMSNGMEGLAGAVEILELLSKVVFDPLSQAAT